jgi:hypothetical protein
MEDAMVTGWIAGHGSRDAPRPARRGLALTPVALIVLAGLVLSACNASSTGGIQTYRAHGVSFDYPAGWRHASQSTNVAVGAVRYKLWGTAFGMDRAHWINVGAYRVNPGPEIGLGPVPPGVKTNFRRLYKQVGGVLQAGPEKITMGGMPGLLARGTRTDQGVVVGNTFAFAFNGTTEYVVICEHERQDTAGMVRACDQVIRTFMVSN